MSPAPAEPVSEQAPTIGPPPPPASIPSSDDERVAAHNFLMLAVYQIVLRTGWIFKTESIIMPAVVDYISGAGWIRGCLPLLNRFGQSIPPLLLARHVSQTPRKKWVVFRTTSLMSGLFLLLMWLFSQDLAERRTSWLPLVFLVIYGTFFTCIGVNQVAFVTVQGKLVEVTRRGRLLQVSNMFGAITAIACALLLLPGWLAEDAPRFDLIFGFSGAVFAASAVTAMLLVESADRIQQAAAASPWHCFLDAYQVLASDRGFRNLAIVGVLFGISFLLFPHYQSLGLRAMNFELRTLMWWVVIQNVGTGLFSLPVGSIADRRGNRLVLQFTMLGIAATPMLAIVLLHAGEWGLKFYHAVFLMLGLTPVVLRTFQDYTLEMVEAEDRPRYLSTLSLCIAFPMFLSPVAGYCLDVFGFEIVFLTLAAIILVGWLLTFRLGEPRNRAVSFTSEDADLER